MRHVHEEENNKICFVQTRTDHRQHVDVLPKTTVFPEGNTWYNVTFRKQSESYFNYGDDAQQFQTVKDEFLLIFV